jgi:type IV pilus assembly protein PilY1
MLCPFNSFAGPDQYCGDTAIYGGTPSVVEPNILVVIDNSGSMGDSVPGGIYDPATTYPLQNRCINSSGQSGQPCSSNAVYTSSYNFFNANVDNITTSCRGANPQSLLKTTGQYNGRRLNPDGSCRRSGTGNYLLGNYVNWRFGPGASKPKIQIARDVITDLVKSTHGVKFGLMTFHYRSGFSGVSAAHGGQFMEVNFSGSTFTTTVSDMTATFTGTSTNRDALVAAIATLTDIGFTPLGETLFEAMRYFQGGRTAFGNTIGVDGSGNYTSPIQFGCQKNYIIFVTDGMDTASDDAVLRTICNNGDCDGDGQEPGNLGHTIDDVAHFLYYNDLRPDAAPGGLAGMQNVITYTIGFDLGADAAAIALLQRTADQNHGHGNYYNAGSETDLSSALTSVITEIFQVNTSFVAPVVPVSPENRTYSGSRVYMGFFKPEGGPFWTGNLKKYGLDDTNNLTDMGGRHATFVDKDNNRLDDRDNAILPIGASDGTFRDTSQSFWSTINDGGEVDLGGVGERVLSRVRAGTARNIYTYLGSAATLTDPSNAFNTTNVSETQLGFTAGDTDSRDELVAYLNGFDPYDEDGNGTTNEARPWILADILHSRPQIVSYSGYTVATDETNCSVNKTMVFVGANDGMLHAYMDCDGSEAWAFIPPDLLSVLQYLKPSAAGAHTYYVDYSPTVYVFNRNKDGNINAANGDRVLLVFGLRRGGGLDTSPTKGYYYALDVTDPFNPVYLWKRSNADAGFSELGEAWSDVTVGKIKVGGSAKIAAFMGAGYDNCNEDARYGPTQTYPGSCVSIPTGDNGATTSAGAAAAVNPKGRGIYVVELATLDSNGIPQLSSSGTKIWGYTIVDNAAMMFSIPGRIKPLDKNYDNFIDTLYAGDMGGYLWRFNIMDTSTTNWTANRIFSSNPGYTNGAADASTGRKIFYEPSAFVQEDGTIRLYFGSGDREHPLNTAVVDRMYGLIDRGQTTAAAVNESNLVDVTEDTLQSLTATDAQTSALVSQLTSTLKYGWYIRLDQNSGEKVLAPALSFNQIVVFTTYSPTTTAGTDPCITGNLGTSRAYVVHYQFGTAVVNFDPTNDATTSANLWARGASSTYNLLRSDRVKTLGGGIPSGAVMVISKTGQTTLMIGVGGSITTLATTGGGVTLPLYWRQKIEYQ